ncbi:hypothetical protein NCAS_0A09630 [Naumovozyma castellii]|uniref:Uncharacterized protein n=1 Tax=Naumovozyma castellii TaxID=27288 RepID=G0V7S3_NAUCA|nr:hypothetical protein NCAS_0A09630 [Naumovozyma castellii CBS 4309]CCC67521.1 hypothetical protein NCAS_0A09630 [Naumovozyma castellii CBS 4309]
MQEAITTLSQEVIKLKKDDAIELNALEQASTAFAKETQQQTELKNIENQDFEQNQEEIEDLKNKIEGIAATEKNDALNTQQELTNTSTAFTDFVDTFEKFRLEQTQFAQKVKSEIINMKQQSAVTQPGTQSGYPIDVQTKIDEIEKFVPDLIIKRSDFRLLACIKNVSDVNLGNIKSDMFNLHQGQFRRPTPS